MSVIFCERNSVFLQEKMFINVLEFETYLFQRFGDSVLCFNELVSFLLNDKEIYGLSGLDVMNQSQVGDEIERRSFAHIQNIFTISDDQIDYLYEIICYFLWFFCGGLSELFKHRQAENEGPRIYIRDRLSSEDLINLHLPGLITAYRGMSIDEYNSNSFGMSWTLCKSKAEEFAFDVYSDKPRGVVVKAKIKRDSVLYYDPTDNEKEVVVANGTISSGDLVAS